MSANAWSVASARLTAPAARADRPRGSAPRPAAPRAPARRARAPWRAAGSGGATAGRRLGRGSGQLESCCIPTASSTLPRDLPTHTLDACAGITPNRADAEHLFISGLAKPASILRGGPCAPHARRHSPSSPPRCCCWRSQPLAGAVAPYDGDNPFRCKTQNTGTGVDYPDPDADPFCVEYDKTQQNVTDFGIVDFLLQEPARVAAAVPKCFYHQTDHWTGSVVAGRRAGAVALGRPLLLRQGARHGRRPVSRTARRGAVPSDPRQLPGFPREFRPYFGAGGGGATRTAWPRSRRAPRRWTRRKRWSRSTSRAGSTPPASRGPRSKTGSVEGPGLSRISSTGVAFTATASKSDLRKELRASQEAIGALARLSAGA